MPLPPSEFQLSRVYAQGWNAARKARQERADPRDEAAGPYAADPERARWKQGFVDGSV